MSSIQIRHSNPIKRAFGIGFNVIANSINLIFAVILQWEFGVVIACMFIQNFILMGFISLRIYRLMGKNYIKMDSEMKIWSPEYSSPVGMTIMLWFAFLLFHFISFSFLNEVEVFSSALTTNAGVILLSCGSYFLHQCYEFFWLKPNYTIKRFKIKGESTPVTMVNSNQLYKSTCVTIIHFFPFFLIVFIILNSSATNWLPGLLIIVLGLELVAQLIEHKTKISSY